MTVERIDLTNCDREPIHIPGSIQPHGVLIACVEPSLAVVAASANCADVLGIPADVMTRGTLAAVLGATDIERLLSHRQEASGVGDGTTGLDALSVTTAHAGHAKHWMALIHRHEGLTIVELEPVNAPHDGPSTTLLLSAASKQLQATTDLVQACQVVVDQIRRITGFARVKLYRFAADWSGEVLAESRDDDMPSYLGLHFPASDIPAQARALYQSSPVRLIANVHYTPSPLLPDRNPVTAGPIDLRFATLRSVSPIHLEYLRNMGTGASMSASILRDGALWGLIACHHREPLLVDFERRQACAMLAQFLASRLDGQERVERARRSVRVEGLRVGMLRGLADGQSVHEALDHHADDWTRLVGADGFAIARSDRTVLAGVVPPEDFVRAIGLWLAATSTADHVAIDRLGSVFPAGTEHAKLASGVLAVPLSRSERSWLLWFRPELLQAVTWAGKPTKTELQLPEGTTLHPRMSFDAWTEDVRGRSAPWTEQDIAAALQLREMLLDLMVREKDDLERQNIRLALSSRELETFIYVAAHDIKEPLRQMEMLASMLREYVRDEAEGEVADYFREFRTLATRLRVLTDQLANYAKLGGADSRFAPVALDDLLEEVLAGLRHAIDDAQAEIVVASALPIVSGEREQLHQVLVNLIGNALKYRAAGRRPRIAIHGEKTMTDADSVARPMTRIVVADNGIGFDPRFGEKVFEAFVRLHSRDRYEGSGIGLAICRRIVERHGGRIEVTATPDVGAMFAFTPPTAPQPSRSLMTQSNKGVIVVAEDSEFDRMVLRRAFAAAKIDIDLTFVQDGEELLTHLASVVDGDEKAPGIVLLDLHMPKMNGRETLQAIRADDRLRHLPIVMLTTSASESHVREFYGLGANSYVVKPNDFDDVVATVKELQAYWFGIARLPKIG